MFSVFTKLRKQVEDLEITLATVRSARDELAEKLKKFPPAELELLREIHKLPVPRFKPGDLVQHRVSQYSETFVVRNVTQAEWKKTTYYGPFGNYDSERADMTQFPQPLYELSRYTGGNLKIIKVQECEIEAVR